MRSRVKSCLSGSAMVESPVKGFCVASVTLSGERQRAEGAVLAADSGGAHLAGAQAGEPALREGPEDMRAGGLHRRLAGARHGGAAEYSSVREEMSLKETTRADSQMTLYFFFIRCKKSCTVPAKR